MEVYVIKNLADYSKVNYSSQVWNTVND